MAAIFIAWTGCYVLSAVLKGAHEIEEPDSNHLDSRMTETMEYPAWEHDDSCTKNCAKIAQPRLTLHLRRTVLYVNTTLHRTTCRCSLKLKQ